MKRKIWLLFRVMLFCSFLQYACSNDSRADETDVASADVSDEANNSDVSIEDVGADTSADVSDSGAEDIAVPTFNGTSNVSAFTFSEANISSVTTNYTELNVTLNEANSAITNGKIIEVVYLGESFIGAISDATTTSFTLTIDATQTKSDAQFTVQIPIDKYNVAITKVIITKSYSVTLNAADANLASAAVTSFMWKGVNYFGKISNVVNNTTFDITFTNDTLDAVNHVGLTDLFQDTDTFSSTTQVANNQVVSSTAVDGIELNIVKPCLKSIINWNPDVTESGTLIIDFKRVVYIATIDNVQVVIELDGSLTLNPTLSISGQVEWFKVKHASVSIVDNSAMASLGLSISATYENSWEKQLGQWKFSPITIMIGEFPLIFTPVLTLNIGAEIFAQADAEYTISQNYTYSLSATYNGSDWTTGHSFTYSPITGKFTWDVKGNAKAYLEPVFTINIEHLGNATINATLSGEFAFDINGLNYSPYNVPDQWGFFGEIDSGIMFDLSIFGHELASWGTNVYSERWTIDTGNL